MTLLPIFYYNETLFPGGRLDLHLFEPRYRVMMQRVVNSTRSFAYVANFNQYRASVGDVALVAVLEEVEFMADGRCMLQAKLSSRMIITEHYGINLNQCNCLCDSDYPALLSILPIFKLNQKPLQIIVMNKHLTPSFLLFQSKKAHKGFTFVGLYRLLTIRWTKLHSTLQHSS